MNDRKFINLVSFRLDGFHWKKDNLANCRCPICGDSESNKHKMRFYLYEKEGKFKVHCHNCGYHNNFSYFLKEFEPNLYKDYLKDNFLRTHTVTEPKDKKLIFAMSPVAFRQLQKVSTLKKDHLCKKYVVSRKLPEEQYGNLYYCPNFMTWVNTIVPNKFDKDALKHDSGRLVIPFFKDGEIHAFTGRALDKDDSVRYILIVLNPDVPSIYGLNRANFNYTTYVFEGPIDSMFIDNSVATCGSGMIDKVYELPTEKMRLVYDNEPRSEETVKKIRSAIRQGFQVVIWPRRIEGKDVNEMVLNNYSPPEIQKVLDTHTYRGLAAELALNVWSKV